MRYKKKLLFDTTIILTMSGWIYIVFGQYLERITFVLAILMFILANLGNRPIIIIKRNILDFIYALFISTFILDFIVSLSIIPLIYGFSMIMVYVMTKATQIEYNGICVYEYIYKISLIYGYTIAVICIVSNGISTYSYQGFMNNPNTFGHFAGTMSMLVLIKMMNKNHKSFDTVSLVFFSFLTICSSCRGAETPVLLGYIIFALRKLYDSAGTKKEFIKRIIKIVFIIVIVVVVIFETDILSIIYKSSIGKSQGAISYMGDITNGRTELWKRVWEESELLGTGKKLMDVPTHNVYLGLMNQFGKINGFSFGFFVILYLIKSIRMLPWRNREEWALWPIMFGIYFLGASMVENVMMTAPMIFMFMGMPLLEKRK